MAITTENVFRQWPTDGSTWSPEFIDIITESLVADRGWIDIETAGWRTKRMKVPGGFKVAGDVEMLSSCEDISKILWGLLGQVESSTPKDSEAFEHLWKPPKQTIPSMAIEINPEVGTQSRLLLGCAIKALTMEFPSREVVSFTPTVLAAIEHLITKTTFGSFATARPLIFYEGDLTIAGSTGYKVNSLSLTIENDIPDDAFVLGDQFLPGILLGGMNITGTMDVWMEDWSLYQRMLGSATATKPEESPATTTLVVDCIGEKIGTSYNYELKLDFPKLVLNTAEANIDRRAHMVYSLPFEALYDTATSKIAEIMVRNSKSAP